jgi:hypothetical protein
MDLQHWFYVSCGYVYALVAGHFLIGCVVDNLWNELGQAANPGVRPFPRHSFLVGVLERFLYVTALLARQPEFIGVWLLLKVVGQWKRWAGGPEHAGAAVPGPAAFNVFLIGNGLSVGFAAAGWKITQWLRDGRTNDAIILVIAFLALAAVFGLLARCCAKPSPAKGKEAA